MENIGYIVVSSMTFRGLSKIILQKGLYYPFVVHRENRSSMIVKNLRNLRNEQTVGTRVDDDKAIMVKLYRLCVHRAHDTPGRN